MVTCFSFIFFLVVENIAEKQQFKLLSLILFAMYSLTIHILRLILTRFLNISNIIQTNRNSEGPLENIP